MTEITRLRPYVIPPIPENWKWKPASQMQKYTPTRPLVKAASSAEQLWLPYVPPVVVAEFMSR